jgi:O-antigen/teichoic acid export membrane protein
MRIIVPAAELRAGFRTLPEILWFGLRVTPGSLADGASAEAGTWILGLFSSVAAVGAWNIAWTVGKRTLDLNIRLAEMLFPTLVQRWADEDRHGFQRALTDSTRYVVTVMLLPAAVAGGATVGTGIALLYFRPILPACRMYHHAPVSATSGVKLASVRAALPVPSSFNREKASNKIEPAHV